MQQLASQANPLGVPAAEWQVRVDLAAVTTLLALSRRLPWQNVLMAGAMISILPVLIIFAFFQRQIVSSLASSGLKDT